MTPYQKSQIEITPERALPFLRAIATNQQIRYAMADAGYGEAEQNEGWQYLLKATGYSAQKLGFDADAAARQAISELDAWDEAGFRRIHAALDRLHPEQDAFVFQGIETSRGASAVLSVALVLDRLDQLEKGTDADRAALATLEKRGIHAKLRAHLRSLVTAAQTAKPSEATSEDAKLGAQQLALESLYAWYRDWSETARAVIHRRDHLIVMGLAKRKPRKEDDSEEAPSPGAPATSTAANAANTTATAAAPSASVGTQK